MRSTINAGLGALVIAGSLPALTGCPGFARSAARNVKSTVSGAGSTARGVVRSGIAGAASVIPAGWTEIQWKEERAKAKEETKGLEQYSGPRYEIQTKGTKLAAMPMKAAEVEPRIAFILDDLLLTEMFNVGFQAIGPDDINDMLGFEAMKDQLGAEETDNLSEIGNTLGVPYLTAGSVAALEGSQVVTLKLIHVETKVVLARVSKMSEGDVKILPRVIAEAVQELVQRSRL